MALYKDAKISTICITNLQLCFYHFKAGVYYVVHRLIVTT